MPNRGGAPGGRRSGVGGTLEGRRREGGCTQGWLLRHAFQLGTQDPVPASIEPEPIIRAINDKGYYIWRDPCWAQRATHWLAATPTSLGTSTVAPSTAR
jgi:hypothetical protein